METAPGASRVSVLRQDGARLVQVGAVTGLGEEGERIYGVRFMGDRGYIVTFRQTDPLYTLDLSNPTAPRVAGQLKIPGYSAYLHPVGENQLLGIGREGTAVKTSLFDVSNLAAPTEVAKLLIPYSTTSVEEEPHAFLYWAPKNLMVMPVQSYEPDVQRRGRRARGAERAGRGRADRAPQPGPRRGRPGLALARDRRQALHAVLARPELEQPGQPGPARLHGVPVTR